MIAEANKSTPGMLVKNIKNKAPHKGEAGKTIAIWQPALNEQNVEKTWEIARPKLGEDKPGRIKLKLRKK